MRCLAALALALAPMLAAADNAGADPASAPAPAVTGAATFRERIAVPPGAVFEATLEDVSRADAPAQVIGRAALREAGHPPYRFAIPLDPAALPPQARLAVRATLAAQGRFLFATESRHAVSAEAPDAGDMPMTAVNAPLALIGPKWVLTALDGRPVPPSAATREPPHLIFAEDGGRAYGSGGCNRLNVGYEAGASGALFMGQSAMTMMACEDDVMEIEQALAQALARADRWAVADGRLTIGAGGAPLAVFAETAP